MNKNKEERKIKAEKHAKEMEMAFEQEIRNSVNGSKIYGYQTNEPNQTEIIIEDSTSEAAVFKYAPLMNEEGKLTVLNFASFTSPGGGFIKGSIAQEEALCHSSNLFNVLSSERFKEYYKVNQENKNDGLYKDFLIYSPNIIFKGKEGACSANVITCAAPNAKVYLKRKGKTFIAILRCVMEGRIKYILDIAEKEEQTVLILGAFGCGVFGNDPYFVADAFKRELKNRSFERVIFAIPQGENLTAFKKVFKKT